MAARIANGEDEDEEEEEEEEQNVTMGDESMDGGEGGHHRGGISHEMGLIADFHVYDIPQFTSKVMQGVANKSLLAMSKHTRKTAAVTEEDLYLLDEI